jgi:hypothetical protein
MSTNGLKTWKKKEKKEKKPPIWKDCKDESKEISLF